MINQLINYIILFLFGSLIGYFLEFIYRNLIDKEYINPGFLKGPYVPLYGIGLVLLNLFSQLEIHITIRIIIFIVLTTSIELVTGLFFLKYFKLHLWDYSQNKANYKGLICPLFSFYWIILSLIYYYFIHSLIKRHLILITSNPQLIFLFGIIFGIFLIDLSIAFNFSYKIRKIIINAKNKSLSFKEFKNRTKIELNQKMKKHFKKNYLKNKGVK